MKRVLLVDVDFVLSGYISKKLHDVGIMVQKASGTEQVLSYMERVKPDCIIVNYVNDRGGILSMFEMKWAKPNIKAIPSIVLADGLQKNDNQLFQSYGVKNIIMKPVQADELLQTIGRLIKINFTFDITQSLVECSLNGGIIFVEIAYGLNRDRIELLHYRIQEILELNELKETKILLIMSNIEISFLDVANLEYLMENLLSVPNAKKEYLKVLTSGEFVKEFLSHHPKYSGIQSAPAIPELLSTLAPEGNLMDILSSMESQRQQSGKNSSISTKLKIDRLEGINVAVVDDDSTVRDSLTAIFKTVKANVVAYEDAESFIKDYKNDKFTIIFLDIVLPGMAGFKCLDRLRFMDSPTPVVILSSIGSKENIVKAFEKGAKQYMVKPIRSDLIIAKTMEILGGTL